MQKQRHYFANKGPSSQGYGFSCGHVWMWDLDCEESWVLKNWCFWTVVLEQTLESPLDCKEIQPVHSEGDQPWVFFGRNDANAETPVLWPPHAKSWLIGKDYDAGRDWGQEEKGTTEDEMARWHPLTRWIWVWVNSGSWWWIGRPGVLRFMGSQRPGGDWSTELNWTELNRWNTEYICNEILLTKFLQRRESCILWQCGWIWRTLGKWNNPVIEWQILNDSTYTGYPKWSDPEKLRWKRLKWKA